MRRRFVVREPNSTRRERKQTITDALLSNVGVPRIGGLLFGVLAAILILASNRVELPAASGTFLWGAILLLAILFFVRLFKEKGLDQLNQWGVISLSLFGFGLGTLIYLLRGWGVWSWIKFREYLSWLWMEFRKIDQPHEWLLTSLFLTGVILGFFVVRNWSKEQGDFVKSLTAVFGGAFVTTLIGEEVGRQTAFAYYAIGFTVSGVLNLLTSSWLIASYSNKKSPSSRSVLTFLYGSDKAEAVDNQFLKNFEEDPIYARRLLVNTVLEYEKKVLIEFAKKREQKRRAQEAAGPLRYFQLIAIECERRAAPAPAGGAAEPPPAAGVQPPPAAAVQPPPAAAVQPPPAAGVQPPAAGVQHPPAAGVQPPPAAGVQPPPAAGVQPLPAAGVQPPAGLQPPPADEVRPALPEAAITGTTPVKIVFRRIRDNEEISERMFRSAVSLKWQDNLEFIDAAAGYTKSFPYFGSVAGLALYVLQTIVMDRDKYKRFRTSEHPQGLCPANIEQRRGLDEIDYLSYIAVPVASYMGQPEQTRLGVLHVDTKLFVANPEDLKADADNNDILHAKLRPADLTEYANNLYDQDDIGVKYLEDMRAVLVPVLQLYLKCRQGSA